MQKEFKICASPLCSNKIWRDGFKFGTGIFCDKYCQDEANFFRPKTPEGREDIERRAKKRKEVNIIKKGGDIYADDYQFEFNPKTI